MSEINVDSRTQRLLLLPSTGTVSVINAGPAGPGVGGGPGTEGATVVYVDSEISSVEALIHSLLPRNTILQGTWPTDPVGYFLLNGQTIVNGAVNYPAFASDNPGWVNGNDLDLPNMDNRVLLGNDTSPGVDSGSMTHTLTEAQLPSHSHSVSGLSVDIDHGHGHSISANQTQHRHTITHTHSNNTIVSGDGIAYGSNWAGGTTNTGGSSATHSGYSDPAITISGGVTNFDDANRAVSGTLGNTGSGSSIDHTPANMTVRFAIKY